MTPKINLIPYRSDRRKAIAQRFFAFLAVSAFAGFAVIGAIHAYNATIIDNQMARNLLIEEENARLDKQIAEIKKLREETAAMISRKQVVESLQANRSRAVMLFNYISQPPEGIFYKNISQKGNQLSMEGYAQSNTYVSNLLRQVEGSTILQMPKLVETKRVTLQGEPEMVEFKIQATVLDLAKIQADKQKASVSNAKKNNNSRRPAAAAQK